MKCIIIDNKIKQYDKTPNSWGNVIGGFDNLTDSELEKYGFYNLVIPEYNSKTEYLGDLKFDEQNKVFTYDIIAKNWKQTLTELKAQKIINLKYIYHQELKKTDWMIVRYTELQTEIPADIKQARSVLRSECDTKENEILSLSSKSDVAEYTLPIL